MSTINQEPVLGAPQTQLGAEMLNTNTINPNMGEIGKVNSLQMMQQHIQMPAMQQPVMEQQVPAMQQPMINQQIPTMEQSAMGMQQMPAMQQPMVQNNLNNPSMVPETMQQTQFPSIPDNNPVAELPNNGNTGILEQSIPNLSQVNTTLSQPEIQMQQPMMQQPMMNQQMMQQPMMNQQMQQPAMGQPMMNQQPMMQQPMMNQQMQQPAMGQPMMNQQMQQPAMGQTAPGYNNGSYLQNNGGMFGATPTGHPEKQKFQIEGIVVYAKVRTSSKGKMMLTGLVNTNPSDRNASASNFICFSESATKQIMILEDPISKMEYEKYLRNYNQEIKINKVSGQTVFLEASWQWNTKSRPEGWQLMCDNLIFVNEQPLRQYAETWTPPVPPSPMDMINGGNMAMGMQQPAMGMQQPAMGMQQPAMGMQQPAMGMQQPAMGQMQIPNMGQMQIPNMGQMQQPAMGMQQPMMGQMPNMGFPQQ